VGLVARYLEANGLPNVIIGSARDVVEHCGVPRFLFTDFPLGNPCGHPWRPDMQRSIVEIGLRLFETATAPRTTVQAHFAWKDDLGWRERYSRVDPAAREKLLKLGEDRRRRRAKPDHQSTSASSPPKDAGFVR
jgi:D-proline reductase (dithiol) PrdB